MGTIANAKVTHYYNCYNGDFIGCLLFCVMAKFIFVFINQPNPFFKSIYESYF